MRKGCSRHVHQTIMVKWGICTVSMVFCQLICSMHIWVVVKPVVLLETLSSIISWTLMTRLFLAHVVLVCSNYWRSARTDRDIKFNAKKSNVTMVRSRKDRKLVSPPLFYLCGSSLMTWKEIKHCGHFLTDSLNDDGCLLTSVVNFAKKLSTCSASISISLCSSHLRCFYRGSLRPVRLLLQDCWCIMLSRMRSWRVSPAFRKDSGCLGRMV